MKKYINAKFKYESFQQCSCLSSSTKTPLRTCRLEHTQSFDGVREFFTFKRGRCCLFFLLDWHFSITKKWHGDSYFNVQTIVEKNECYLRCKEFNWNTSPAFASIFMPFKTPCYWGEEFHLNVCRPFCDSLLPITTVSLSPDHENGN